MKICIVGAGAIGGFLGTKLAVAGRAEVCAVARGDALAALRTHGWRLQSGDALLQAPAHASDRPSDLGLQDVVVIAVKGPALTRVAEMIQPLLGPNTLVLPAMNGVPWWFAQGLGAIGTEPLASVDPECTIGRAIATDQVVGCVVHASTSTPEPGLVQHKMGQGLIVGEPGGGRSARVAVLADLLAHAGFDVTHSDNIRYDIWYKLWGNMTMNPVSAITGATTDLILADPLVREFCSAVMREAAQIGNKLGCVIDQAPQERHAMTSKLGAFQTSMLQDVHAGRALELDALVAVVRELALRVDVPTPHLDALLGLTRLFAQVQNLYPNPLQTKL